MTNRDAMLLRKYARSYKTKESFVNSVKQMPFMKNLNNERMVELSLEGYWIFFKELTDMERIGRSAEKFVHGYVSKKIHEVYKDE